MYYREAPDDVTPGDGARDRGDVVFHLIHLGGKKEARSPVRLAGAMALGIPIEMSLYGDYTTHQILSGCNMLQQERFPMQRPFCGRQLFQCELEHTLAVNVFDAPIGVVCLDTSEQLALDHHS